METLEENRAPAAAEGKECDAPIQMTKTQKKNRRKALRSKMKKAEDKEQPQQSEVVELPVDRVHEARLERFTTIQNQLKAMEYLERVPYKILNDVYVKQQKELEALKASLIDILDNDIKKIKHVNTQHFPMKQIVEQLKALYLDPEADQEQLEYLVDHYSRVLAWENAKQMRAMIMELLQTIATRKQKNADHYAEFSKHLELQRVVSKLKEMKRSRQLDDSEIDVNSIQSREFQLSSEAQSIVCPKDDKSRFEAIFCVVCGRPQTKQAGLANLVVYGLKDDIEEVVRFIKEAKFNGECQVQLDEAHRASFVGPKGASIRRCEQDWKCFLVLDSASTLTLYGSRANVEAAQKKLATKSELVASTGKPNSAEVAVKNHLIALALLIPRFTESLQLTSDDRPISFSPGSGPAKVLVQAKSPEALTEVLKKIPQVTKALETATVKAPSQQVLRKIYLSDFPFTRASQLDGFTGPQKWGSVWQPKIDALTSSHPQTAIFKQDSTTVALAGPQEEVTKCATLLEEIFKLSTSPPTHYDIAAALRSLAGFDTLTQVEKDHEVVIKKLPKAVAPHPDQICFEIYGSPEKVQSAVSALNEVIREKGCMAVLSDVTQATRSALFRNGMEFMDALRADHDVNITIDRNANTITIVGTQQGVDNVKAILEEMDQKEQQRLSDLETHVFNFRDRDQVLKLLGPKGSTIQGIIRDTQVANIEVDKAGLKAAIIGSHRACENAKARLQELFYGQQKMTDQGDTTSRTVESAKPQAPTPSSPAKHIMPGPESFPAIDDVVQVAARKPKPARWKKLA